MTLRPCVRCGVAQPLDAFARDRRRPDGAASACLACERARNYAAYWARPEAKREAARERYRRRHSDKRQQSA